MKKKFLSLTLAIGLLATAAIGGTLAYFTDTEQATNTMVIGNVEINIDEVTYTDKDGDGTKEWAPFVDDEFTLYPLDDAQGDALMNKVVYTANTSSSKDDAYIRNIVLFEYNDKAAKTDCCLTGLHFGYAMNDKSLSPTDGKTYVGSKSEYLGIMEVDGKKYEVVSFVEKDGNALKYDEALYSMSEVWMDKNVTQEVAEGWYEDNNSDGDFDDVGENKVDIIVFSQGIQATGLTHDQAMTELGAITADNLSKWIDTDDAVINDWTNKGQPVINVPEETPETVE